MHINIVGYRSHTYFRLLDKSLLILNLFVQCDCISLSAYSLVFVSGTFASEEFDDFLQHVFEGRCQDFGMSR